VRWKTRIKTRIYYHLILADHTAFSTRGGRLTVSFRIPTTKAKVGGGIILDIVIATAQADRVEMKVPAAVNLAWVWVL
jgi:hypothetical protein